MSQEYIKRIFAKLDAMQIESFVAFFAEDGQMRTGNEAALVGRDAIRATFGGMSTALKELHHEFINIWEEENVVIVESLVTYTRQDNTALTLPAVTILRMTGDLIQDYRVYMDIRPVFEHTQTTNAPEMLA